MEAFVTSEAGGAREKELKTSASGKGSEDFAQSSSALQLDEESGFVSAEQEMFAQGKQSVQQLERERDTEF
jgi:hypothetical protein